MNSRTTGITEHEVLTQRKSKTDDRVLRVHAIVIADCIQSNRFPSRKRVPSSLCRIGIAEQRAERANRQETRDHADYPTNGHEQKSEKWSPEIK